MQVFLSVGRVATEQQRLFLDRLEAKLRNRGLDPRTIGRNTFTAGLPLDRIVEVMKGCSAILVLAFERTCVEKGYELRPNDEEPLRFDTRRYASPWHHIELAMAHMLELPTLAIVERGVCEEGLLEDKYGWYVIRTRLELSALDSDECSGIIDDWSNRAKAPRSPQKFDVEKLTIGDLAKTMKPAQMWAVIAALLTVLAGAFAFGRLWSTNAIELSTTPKGNVQASLSPLSNKPVEIVASGSQASQVTATTPANLTSTTITTNPSTTTTTAQPIQVTASALSPVEANDGAPTKDAVSAFFGGSFCIQATNMFIRCNFKSLPPCEDVRKIGYAESYYRCVETPRTVFCYGFTSASGDRRFYCTATEASCSFLRQVNGKETNKSQCTQFQL